MNEINLLVIIFSFLILFIIVSQIYECYESFQIEKNKKNDLEKHNILSRVNSQNYLKNVPFVKFLKSNQLEKFVKNENKMKEVKRGTILFVSDTFPLSACKVQKNWDNFLDNRNIELLLCENWGDSNHKKLKMWPIGLPACTISKNDRYAGVTNLDFGKLFKEDKKYDILCNAHFGIYKNPLSKERDDRTPMLKALKKYDKISFWSNKKRHDINLLETTKYKYCLAPEGNCLDTYRFYEAYLCNSLPIVRKGKLTPLHSQFPGTVVVDEWEDVKKIKLDRKPNQNKIEMITVGYWVHKYLLPYTTFVSTETALTNKRKDKRIGVRIFHSNKPIKEQILQTLKAGNQNKIIFYVKDTSKIDSCDTVARKYFDMHFEEVKFYDLNNIIVFMPSEKVIKNLENNKYKNLL